MNFVNVTAPIAIDDLKKYFADKTTFYIIDYKNSSLKGAKLLTYLSNLDIPADISFEGSSDEEVVELIKEYMNCSFILNVSSLENVTIDILLRYKAGDETISDFVEENKDIISSWIKKIESLSLYNMMTVSDDMFKEYVEQFPKDTTDSLVGVNFISLIKNENMYLLFHDIKQENLTYYVKYFNDYMFKGKNLYSYWANENNPLFLLTNSIATGFLTQEKYETAIQQEKELLNVSSI